MKVMVTGGAGFIASHVTDAYINNGHKVAVVDNLASGLRKNLNPKAKFYKADIRDLAKMEEIFQEFGPEIVNHHAAIAEVVKSVRDPVPTYEVNVIGMGNVLLLFGKYKRGGKSKFIFSSTGGAIYGEPNKLPADESTPAIPLSPYGLSKLLGEEMVKFYSRQYNFPYLIFRYPNVYGPRQNPKGEAGVVAIFGGLMKQKIRPTIFGDGSKARDYVFVSDIVRANITALHRAKNATLNLGSGQLTTDQMIFDAIAIETKYTKLPRYAPYRKGEVYQISLDARKARRILGWRPLIRLKQGVAKSLQNIH